MLKRMERLGLLLLTLVIGFGLGVARFVGAGNPASINVAKVVYLDGVATGAQQLVAVTTTGLPNGTRAWVASVGDWFDLGPATGVSDQALVLVSTPDGRQWRRSATPNRVFIAAPFWSISSSGSDEAVGWGASESDADAHPLRSLQELDRRLAGYRVTEVSAAVSAISVTIHFMDDITTADRFTVLHNIRGSSNTFIRITGTLNPVDGSASNRTIATYQAAVPATNTERQLTITGLGTTPQYVGKLVQTTDGAKVAVVTRQTGADELSISQVDDHATASLDGVTPSSVSDFSVGDHVTFYDPVNIPSWPLPPDVPFVLADQLQFVATTEVWQTSLLGESFVQMHESILGAGADGSPEEYEFHGASQFILQSCAMFATHANIFWRARLNTFSVAVLVNGDGPFIEGEMSIVDEMSIALYRNGGSGWRCQGEHPCNIVVDDDGVVAAFGMVNSIFGLYSTHVGVPGHFIGSDSNTGSKSRFYGVGVSGFGVVVGQGAHCKFPKTGITYTVPGYKFMNLAGIGLSDTFHNYDVSDIPVADTATGTYFLDSNPGVSGGRF